jgi:hypothetical protein
MKKSALLNLFKIFLIISVSTTPLSLAADEFVSIVGEINEYFQIITDDGEVYTIGDTEKGAELDVLAGKRVEAMGNLINTDGELVLLIESYKVVDSNN